MGFLDIVKKKQRENPIISAISPMMFLGMCAKEYYDTSLREEGFKDGYRQGNVDAAKKFAALLEQSDNFRIGAFAVGYYVARLGKNSNEKFGVIVDALGAPDSALLSSYVRGENSKIIRYNPSFSEIRQKYLDSLSAEQLQSIDGFLSEIISAGGSSQSELDFYSNEWSAYLNSRG